MGQDINAQAEASGVETGRCRDWEPEGVSVSFLGNQNMKCCVLKKRQDSPKQFEKLLVASVSVVVIRLPFQDILKYIKKELGCLKIASITENDT